MKFKRMLGSVFECENRAFVFLFVFFLLGIVFGAFYGCKLIPSDLNEASSILSEFVLSENFGQVILKKLIVYLIVFLLGYTVIGTPFICFAIVYDGICCGIICGMFCMCYGFKGCVAAVLCFYFYFLINVTAIVYLAFSSMRLSLALFNVFKSETKYIPASMYSNPHIIKFVFFLSFIFLGAFYYLYISRFIFNLLI